MANFPGAHTLALGVYATQRGAVKEGELWAMAVKEQQEQVAPHHMLGEQKSGRSQERIHFGEGPFEGEAVSTMIWKLLGDE